MYVVRLSISFSPSLSLPPPLSFSLWFPSFPLRSSSSSSRVRRTTCLRGCKAHPGRYIEEAYPNASRLFVSGKTRWKRGRGRMCWSDYFFEFFLFKNFPFESLNRTWIFFFIYLFVYLFIVYFIWYYCVYYFRFCFNLPVVLYGNFCFIMVRIILKGEFRGFARRWLPSRLCSALIFTDTKPSGCRGHAATESAHLPFSVRHRRFSVRLLALSALVCVSRFSRFPPLLHDVAVWYYTFATDYYIVRCSIYSHIACYGTCVGHRLHSLKSVTLSNALYI